MTMYASDLQYIYKKINDSENNRARMTVYNHTSPGLENALLSESLAGV